MWRSEIEFSFTSEFDTTKNPRVKSKAEYKINLDESEMDKFEQPFDKWNNRAVDRYDPKLCFPSRRALKRIGFPGCHP